MFRIALILLCLFSLGAPAWALTPPWTPEELTQAAAAIVEGTVGSPITCRERYEHWHCGKRGRYAVPFTITKISKGAEHLRVGQTITLHFWQNLFTKGCVGDQGADHYPGETGRYYLARSGDGWTTMHWSGAEVRTQGSGRLPRCR